MIKNMVCYLGDPANVGKLKKAFYVILAVVFVSDFLVHREHAEHLWEKIPGWGAFYGFVSCVIIIIVSKFIGHHGIMKKEDYYGD